MHFSTEERQEFKSLVLPHLDGLHRLALRLCHDQCNAEDLVAETITKACENFRRLRDRSRMKAWLCRILSNTFFTYCREAKRVQHVEYIDPDRDDERGRFSLFDEVSQPFLLWWGKPERELIDKLLDADIQRAIGELPEEYRVAVVLCDVEGLSYREIAGILRIPIGTVRSRLARGRSLLQKKLWHHAQEIGLIPSRKHNHEKATKVHQAH